MDINVVIKSKLNPLLNDTILQFIVKQLKTGGE